MPARLHPLTPGVVPAIVPQHPVHLIGRHSECDSRIDLPKISRRHCCLALADDRLLIRDLGSRNGIRVNGEQVEETQLFPGDEVAIGPVLYRVESSAPSPAAQPPPQPVDEAPAPKPARLPSFSMGAGETGEDLMPISL